MVAQVFTLIGVALGALASYLATSASERARDRREVAKGWEQRKFDCYAEFLHEAKLMCVLARRMAASLGLTERSGDRLAPEEGAPLLTEAEVRRAVAMEKLRLLADANTTAAVARINEVVWRMEWIARGLIDASPEQWRETDEASALAFDEFHRCARRELGAPGLLVPRAFIPLPAEGKNSGAA